MDIITLLSFLISLNLSSQLLFDDLDYRDNLRINIISDLTGVMRLTGRIEWAFYNIGSKPFKGYIQFIDSKGSVTKQIPVLFMRRGGNYRPNLRMLVPATKEGKEKYIKGSIFEGVKFSTIDPQELKDQRFQELAKYRDKDKLFLNKKGEYKFIKMINFTGKQIGVIKEFTAFKGAEVFLPKFNLRTRLFKGTYYDCGIKSFKDKIFDPKRKRCKLFQIYNDFYGFFIEPVKSARKRAGLKKYNITTEQDLMSKLGIKHIIENIIFSYSPFGSVDWGIWLRRQTIIPRPHNISLGYDKGNQKILIAHYDFDAALFYQSESKCQLDKYAYLPKDILAPGGEEFDLLEYALGKNEEKYFRSIEEAIYDIIQKKDILINLAIELDKREANLLKKQRNEMQVCVKNYIESLKRLVNPQYRLTIINELNNLAVTYDAIRANATWEDISRHWEDYKFDELRELVSAMKNNAVFDEPQRYWFDQGHEEISSHKYGTFIYKNKKYKFNIIGVGAIKIYAPSE